MAKHINIDRIRRKLKEWTEEEQATEPTPKQETPKLSAKKRLELLNEIEPNLRAFLLEYTKLLHDTGEVYSVNTDNLREMRAKLSEIMDDESDESDAIMRRAFRYYIAIDRILKQGTEPDAAGNLARFIYTFALEKTEQPVRLYDKGGDTIE